MRKKWVVCMIACLTILLTGCNGNTAKETARNDTDKRISSTAGNTETTTETEKADDTTSDYQYSGHIHVLFYHSLCRHTYCRTLHSVWNDGSSVRRRSRRSGLRSQSSFCHSRTPLSVERQPHSHTHSLDNGCCPPRIHSKVLSPFHA